MKKPIFVCFAALVTFGMVSNFPKQGYATSKKEKTTKVPICKVIRDREDSVNSTFHVALDGPWIIADTEMVDKLPTIEEAIKAATELRKLGVCKSAPSDELRACRLEKLGSYFVVSLSNGSIIRENRLAYTKSFDEAKKIISLLGQARLCKGSPGSRSVSSVDVSASERSVSGKSSIDSSAISSESRESSKASTAAP